MKVDIWCSVTSLKGSVVVNPHLSSYLKVAGILPEALKRKNEGVPHSFIGGRRGPRTLEKVEEKK